MRGTVGGERRAGGFPARLLAPFADVRPGEAGTALLMAGQAFVLLSVYYLLKPVRESWILPGGAELKTYLAATQALGLVGVAKAYDHLARRVRRDHLVAIATGTVIACLLAFHALATSGVDVAVAFYLWLGAFQLLLIAQFWSFATDLYTPEQGRRIFAVLGAGAALGSVGGAQLSRFAMRTVDRPATLLPLAAVLLLAVPVLATLAHRRASGACTDASTSRASPVPGPLEARGMIARVLVDPYLRLVALFTVLLNAITTIGEYALDRTLLDAAALAVAHGEVRTIGEYVGTFKADYYAAINLLVLALQLFAVSRVLRVGGVRLALAIMPFFVVVGALAVLGAAALAVPLLVVMTSERVVENGIAHSIQSTARQSLYLLTTRGGRWGGKAFIDTVTWRLGDVLGALFVAALAAVSAGTREVVLCALVIAVGWIFVWRALGKQHRARELELG